MLNWLYKHKFHKRDFSATSSLPKLKKNFARPNSLLKTIHYTDYNWGSSEWEKEVSALHCRLMMVLYFTIVDETLFCCAKCWRLFDYYYIIHKNMAAKKHNTHVSRNLHLVKSDTFANYSSNSATHFAAISYPGAGLNWYIIAFLSGCPFGIWYVCECVIGFVWDGYGAMRLVWKCAFVP